MRHRILGLVRRAPEIRPLLDGEILMNYVPFDMTSGFKSHAERPNRTMNASSYDYVLGNDSTLNVGTLSKNQREAVDVTMNTPIDVNLPLGGHIADNCQVLANC